MSAITDCKIKFLPSSIKFEKDSDGRLNVSMDTERLHLESIKEEDTDNCVELFGDKEVMNKYAEREPRSKESVEKRINDSWLKRWKENDPFSGISVRLKKTNEYIGCVVVGYGDKPGESEMAILLKKHEWNKGYGTEAVGAMIYGFAPETIKKGYLLEKKPLNKIYATSSSDNKASWKLLEKVGMIKERTEFIEKYNMNKDIYSISSDKFYEA